MNLGYRSRSCEFAPVVDLAQTNTIWALRAIYDCVGEEGLSDPDIEHRAYRILSFIRKIIENLKKAKAEAKKATEESEPAVNNDTNTSPSARNPESSGKDGAPSQEPHDDGESDESFNLSSKRLAKRQRIPKSLNLTPAARHGNSAPSQNAWLPATMNLRNACLRNACLITKQSRYLYLLSPALYRSRLTYTCSGHAQEA